MDPNAVDKLRLLLQLRRFTEVERAAREVIAENPQSSSGYYYLAKALGVLGRFQEALEVSDRLLALAPDQWFAHSLRSTLLQFVGRSAEAVESAKTAMRLDHNEPSVHTLLAYVLSAAGRDKESAAVISEARRQFPADPDILYMAGALALDRKDMAAVDEVAKRGLALDPTNPGFHMLTGVATGHQAQNDVPEGQERQNRFRVAEQRLAEAVRMDPTNAEFRRQRKKNASDSRDEIMVKLITTWMFGMAICAAVLPIILHVEAFPCWFFLLLPLAAGVSAGVLNAVFPEFSLILPLKRFDVVTIPLLPEERRKGLAGWFVFLVATVSILFIPILALAAPVLFILMLLVLLIHRLTARIRRARAMDSDFSLPAKGKAHER